MILEDTDHDGRADRHTVFWDQGPEADQRRNRLRRRLGALSAASSCSFPTATATTSPTASRRSCSTAGTTASCGTTSPTACAGGRTAGFTAGTAFRPRRTSGLPGTLPAQRTPLNCCIWRYHPTRKIFEVVCRGTTNPWGMDWNEQGELFFINTVIGHLWHAVPGAHFQRMYGEDDNPHLYELLGPDGRPLPLGHGRALERYPQDRRLADDRPGRRRTRSRRAADLPGRQLARSLSRHGVHDQLARPPAQQRQARTTAAAATSAGTPPTSSSRPTRGSAASN